MLRLNQLNLTSLETQVLDAIESTYNAMYLKPLKVHVEAVSPTLNYYELQLFLQEEYTNPYIIATQCGTDQDFIDFIVEELKKIELVRRKQFELVIYGNE